MGANREQTAAGENSGATLALGDDSTRALGLEAGQTTEARPYGVGRARCGVCGLELFGRGAHEGETCGRCLVEVMGQLRNLFRAGKRFRQGPIS